MTRKEGRPITDIHQEYSVYDGYVLTKYGSLIGAIELEGRDPDALLEDDHVGLSFMARNIYNKVDSSIAITQYYSHFDGAKVHLKNRDDLISQELSKQLAGFLNSKNLTDSHLIHYFEIFPSEQLNKLNLLQVLKHIFSASFSEKSKVALKEYFRNDTALIVHVKELERQVFELTKTLKEVAAKWSSVMDARICSIKDIWHHKRFLSNLHVHFMDDSCEENYPNTDWDKVAQSGDISHIIIKNTDMLKFNGALTKYARIASVIDFGEKRVTPGIWNLNEEAPLRLNGNFIAMLRWKPLSMIQKAMLFKRKKDDIQRSTLNFSDMMTGHKKSIIEQELTMSASIKNQIKELDEAEKVTDKWGSLHAAMMVFDANPDKVIETSVLAEKSFSSVGMKVVWETIDLTDALASLQICGGEHSVRDMYFHATQFGASSLVYKPSIGQKTIHLSKKEEAQYFLQTADGSVFHYSPIVGGKSLEIGVGPTRSGKSFLKNTIDAHFLKYGGILRAIDIDPGTEMLAKAFGKEGSIFKLSDNEIQGLNLFASSRGEEDRSFIRHLRSMLLGMMLANDQEDLKKLKEEEQEDLDKAITATLRLPKKMQRLGYLVRHMQKPLARKFHRWVYNEDDNGMYAELFDAAEDSIGSLDTRVAVCNLQGIAKDETALGLVMMDYFYRVTSAFEDPSKRHIPKKLAVDEAHHFLKYPGIVDFLESKIRTWGKFLGGISLWTQSPSDYLKIPKWDVLRSSASAFIFTADAEMDDEIYKEAFGLTKGECEQIRNLEPKREVYIIQREINVSKKVILEVDPWQYVISTSNPIECTVRNDLIGKYGFKKGVEATIVALEEMRKVSEDKRALEIEHSKRKYYGE